MKLTIGWGWVTIAQKRQENTGSWGMLAPGLQQGKNKPWKPSCHRKWEVYFKSYRNISKVSWSQPEEAPVATWGMVWVATWIRTCLFKKKKRKPVSLFLLNKKIYKEGKKKISSVDKYQWANIEKHYRLRGGGLRMGVTCPPMADSRRGLKKTTTILQSNYLQLK